MQVYEIELTEEEASNLRKRAERLGVSYRELLRSSVRQIIELSDDRIKKLIADSVRHHEQALKRLA